LERVLWLSYKAAIVATTVAEYAGIAVQSSRSLAKSQATAAELANTEAQLAICCCG